MSDKGEGAGRLKKKNSIGASMIKKMKGFCPSQQAQAQSQSFDSGSGSGGGGGGSRVSRDMSSTDDANTEFLAAITGTGTRSGTSTTVCTPSHASMMMGMSGGAASSALSTPSFGRSASLASSSGSSVAVGRSMPHEYSHPFIKGEPTYVYRDEPDVCEPVRSMPRQYVAEEELSHRSVALSKPQLPERYASAPGGDVLLPPSAAVMHHSASYGAIQGVQQPLPSYGMFMGSGGGYEAAKMSHEAASARQQWQQNVVVIGPGADAKEQFVAGGNAAVTTGVADNTVSNSSSSSVIKRASRLGQLKAQPLPPFPFLLSPNSHFRVSCAREQSSTPCSLQCKLATIVDCIDRCLGKHKVDFEFHEDTCKWVGVRYTPSSFMNVDVVVYEAKAAEPQCDVTEYVVELQLRDGDRGDFRALYAAVLEAFKKMKMEPIIPSEAMAIATRWGRRCHSERLTRSSMDRLAELVSHPVDDISASALAPPPPVGTIKRRPSSGSYPSFGSVPASLRPLPAFASHSSVPDSFDFLASSPAFGGSGGDKESEETGAAEGGNERQKDDDLQPIIRLCEMPCCLSNLEGARLLSQMSAVDNNIEVMAKEEVVSALAKLAKPDDYPKLCPQSRAFAVFALSNLSESPECHALIAKTGVLPALLKLAAHGCGHVTSSTGAWGAEEEDASGGGDGGVSDIEMRRECARLLANLSASFGDEIMKEVGSDVVREWLNSIDELEDERLKMHAKRARRLLGHLAMHEDMSSPRKTVNNAGVVAF